MNDLDGDGVEDEASEGSCCLNGYGIDFADSSCGSTLAEVAASCCGDGWLARSRRAAGWRAADRSCVR